MRSLLLVLAVAGCGDTDKVRHLPDAPPPPDVMADAPVDAPSQATVLDTNFEGALPATIDPGTGLLTPSQDFAPLGGIGPTFLRCQTGNSVTVSLANLPPHGKLTIGFIFAAIDSLDGTGSFPAGDFMKITLDGTQIFRESFANATPDQIQSYVAPPGGELARHQDLGFGGPGGFYTDSLYDMNVDTRFHDLAHTAQTATIVFTLEGEGVQSLDDESWAIDNLRVTIKE